MLLFEMELAKVRRIVLVPPSWEGDRNDLALEAVRLHPDKFAVMQNRHFLTDGSADRLWPAAEKAGVPPMVLAPGSLDALDRSATRHPGLKLVIDYVGLNIREKGPSPSTR